MNKNLLLIFLIFLSIGFVNADSIISETTESASYESDMNVFQEITQSWIYFEDVWGSYFDGDINFTTALDLGGFGLDTVSQLTVNYESMTSGELETYRDIIAENTFFENVDVSSLNTYIDNRLLEENKTYSKYLEYEALKNQQKENINRLWVQIISFTELIIEVINIMVYLLGFYLFVFVVIEAIPLGLVFMRDKILENYLKKRGYKQ